MGDASSPFEASLPKKAWVTLVTAESYLPGAVLLAYSLRKHNSKYPLIILTTCSFPSTLLPALQQEIDLTNSFHFDISPLMPPAHNLPDTLIAARFRDTWTKLRVFELHRYGCKSLVFLDADMLVRQNMDELFNIELPGDDWIAANHACVCNLDHDSWAPKDWEAANCAYTGLNSESLPAQVPTSSTHGKQTHTLLNSGLFIFTPHEKQWIEMQNFLAEDPRVKTYMFPDQDLLADFFSGRWQSVSWRYNALKTMRYWHANLWRDEDVRNLHYIVDKPWAKRVGADGVAGYLGRDGITHSWWWEEYESWKKERVEIGATTIMSTMRHAVAAPIEPIISYFTCTLGEAQDLNRSSPHFATVNSFLDFQAEKQSSAHAVGFPKIDNSCNDYHIFSFSQLRNGSIAVATELNSVMSTVTQDSRCVALLCPSSLDFLFAWLGLMRLGYSVVLIAPQCHPEAVINLCRSCKVSLLFHDTCYSKLATTAARKSLGSFSTLVLPWQSSKASLISLIGSSSTPGSAHFVPRYSTKPLDVAYIFHSSGTSSGIPKPIPQSHHAAIGVLPQLDGSKAATFTTTPLYHGGIADCLRAWTSNALIWHFPGGCKPITSQNILRCITVSKLASEQDRRVPKVKYFSSVPYVLNLLASDLKGMELLQEMDLVGVGGASLPTSIGDELVRQEVKLISRFGSAECGFLLSSQRDFQTDSHWQHLRVPRQSHSLNFENLNDGSNLAELIVRKSWPHLAKSNRPDGSYATSDLFQRHPTIENAWRYHSRSDGQITLSTGKKFDPAPLEECVVAASPLIQDVLVVGTGRQFPGALVFVSNKTEPDKETQQSIIDVVEKATVEGDDHTRISRNMVCLMLSNSPEILKSSKGTILRGPTEALFSAKIDSLYNGTPMKEKVDPDLCLGDEYLEEAVMQIVNEISAMANKLEFESDFYKHGVDSMKATQIRSAIQNRLMGEVSLPWNVIYDCGNIRNLTAFIMEQKSGKTLELASRTDEMLELVEQYSNFIPAEPRICPRTFDARKKVVFLTGATGALGAHILHNLCADPSISRIICLVRGSANETSKFRVSESLRQRKLSALVLQDNRVQCVPCCLHELDLGLTQDIIHILHETSTHFIHAAWNVNFSLPLRSFLDDISGLQNIIQLLQECYVYPQLTFCSSTASVINTKTGTVVEQISKDPTNSDSLGYSKSKWVAEAICARASELLKLKVNIIRVGQLTGDTKNGVWNMTEAWPLMLSTVNELGCLPNLQQPLSWLPFDVAADAVVEISLSGSVDGGMVASVFHVLNNRETPFWSDLLLWIQKVKARKFEIVEPQAWLEKLKSLNDHPARKLLGLWDSGIGRSQPSKVVEFNTSMKDTAPLDEIWAGKMWSWIEEETKRFDIETKRIIPQ